MKKYSEKPSGLWPWFINFIHSKFGTVGIVILVVIAILSLIWWNWDNIQKKPFIKNLARNKIELTGDSTTSEKTKTQIERSHYEIISYVEKSLSELNNVVSEYKKDRSRSSNWLIASSQLYILFVDISNEKPLVEKVIPGIKYHPLRKDLTDLVGKFDLYMPRIIMNKGEIAVDLFDMKVKKIDLHAWLNQTIAILNYNDKGYPITIRTLIEYSYLYEGGGHYSVEIDETAKALSGFMFLEGGTHVPFFQKILITVSDYLVKETWKEIDSLTKS